jgi:hypothetical protein
MEEDLWQAGSKEEFMEILMGYAKEMGGAHFPEGGDGKDMKMDGPWWDMFNRVAADLRSDSDSEGNVDA